MNDTWVVVASHNVARIFKTDSIKGPLQEISDMVDPSARLHGRDLESDRPGRQSAEVGSSRHGLSGRTSIRQNSLKEFAARIADSLNKACAQRQYQNLFLLAEPPVLGALRNLLDEQTRMSIKGELPCNLAKHSEQEILDHLQQCH